MVERKWKPLPIKEIRPIVQQVCAKTYISKHQQTGNQTTDVTGCQGTKLLEGSAVASW